MSRPIILIFSFLLAVCSLPAWAGPPSGAVYLDGGDNKSALILAHGRGKHPTWKVVDPLRRGVHAQLGYHTLSLQMPNEDKPFKEYAEDFPEAYRRIEDGIRFLREEHGVTKFYLMGHSMGSRMSSAFIAANSSAPISGLIIAGCRNTSKPPLDCKVNMAKVRIPVLDIWGGGDRKDTDAASEREEFVSAKYQQVAIPGANHKFDGYDEEFVDAVVAWLRGQP